MAEYKPGEIGHEVDDLVITCMDHRFQQSYADILEENNISSADRIAFPGSSKAVADNTLLPAIQTSHRLHKINRVWIFDHTDCGGFGTLEAFDSDEAKEAQAHFETLEKARKVIHRVLPHLTVVNFVIGLNGEEIKTDRNPMVGPSHQRQA